MKNTILYLAMSVIFVLLLANPLKAQDTLRHKKTEHKTHVFVDKDGDGYNDNAPDDDGDGIPNSLDPDWYKKKKSKTHQDQPYIDLNGDGINDYEEQNNSGKGKKNMQGVPATGMDKGGNSLNTKMTSTKGKLKKGGGKR